MCVISLSELNSDDRHRKDFAGVTSGEGGKKRMHERERNRKRDTQAMCVGSK